MIKFLIEKEFKHIIRHSFIPKMLIGMPVIWMLVMPWAANQEVKNIKLSIVDQDKSSYSRRIIQKIAASGNFYLVDYAADIDQAMKSIESGKADIVLEIPSDCEKDLVKTDQVKVMIAANAVNGTQGSIGSAYLRSIINDFAREIQEEQIPSTGGNATLPLIKLLPQNRYNPHMDYKVFMVPALMVMILTMLCGYLPALNIVGEKESGTIEQMNVTPVSKFTFIMAKLIPYWLIGFVVLTVCFGLAALAYGLIPAGKLSTIYLFAGIYILIVSGFGLVVSNYSSTLQQAMFVMFFFVMIFLLMSGLFTPVNSMPKWAQWITVFNPLKYFMQVMRMVYLKGSGIAQLIPQLIALIAFALFFNLWAIISYRKSS